jgi:hypothetical protein
LRHLFAQNHAAHPANYSPRYSTNGRAWARCNECARFGAQDRSGLAAGDTARQPPRETTDRPRVAKFPLFLGQLASVEGCLSC